MGVEHRPSLHRGRSARGVAIKGLGTIGVVPNQATGGYAELRLRTPDPALGWGTPHGYLAAIQRDAEERFGDQVVAKDRSHYLGDRRRAVRSIAARRLSTP